MQGKKRAYVSLKAGVLPDANSPDGLCLQAFYPLGSAEYTKEPFVLRAGDCFFSDYHLMGSLSVSEQSALKSRGRTDFGAMEWDLESHKSVAANMGPLCGSLGIYTGAMDTYWHSEGIRTFFRGTVILGADIYDVLPEESCGYTDKHYGKNYDSSWFQFAAGSLYSKRTKKTLQHSALALSGNASRFYFLPVKNSLLMQLTYRGQDFEFNFTRPGLLTRIRLSLKKTNKRRIWHVKAQNKNAVAKLSISVLHDSFFPLPYEATDSTKLFDVLCAGNATATLEIFQRNGRKLIPLDTLSIQDGLCLYRTAKKRRH